MKNWFKQFIPFGLLGIGLLLLKGGGVADQVYINWITQKTPEIQSYLPKSYALIGYMLMFFWAAFCAWLYVLIDASGYSRWHMTLKKPAFYAHISNSFQVYFTDRLHELKRGTLHEHMSSEKGHNKAIIDALYALRETLIEGYDPADVRVSLMIPERVRKDDPTPPISPEEVRLYLHFYANELKSTPETLKKGIGFSRGEGYAGAAWKSGRPQIGGKRTIMWTPDRRFKPTSIAQDNVKSFCSIPIRSEGSEIDNCPIVAVLNIDTSSRFYFPLKDKNQWEFCKALHPFIILILFHLVAKEDAKQEEVVK